VEHLEALASDLADKGYLVRYVDKEDSQITNFVVFSINLDFMLDDDRVTICSIYTFEMVPHVLYMVNPDWQVDLRDPDSIGRLYTELENRFACIRLLK
jgi:hypothetical protein